ncbi:fungal-specific transcription factor domain-containing protein [Cyathus striatus]|nr:fungal-specific transcription factor domain-containing protein [Cyathus striatus]
MSSTDEDPSSLSSQKKRKITQRACDHCRLRKSGEPTPPHAKCPNCVEQGLECTFSTEPKLCPNQLMLHSLVCIFDPEYAATLTNMSTAMSISAPSALTSVPTTPEKAPSDSIQDVIHKIASLSLGSEDDPFRDDDVEKVAISKRIQVLSVKPESENKRFWGKSSSAMLMHTAVLLKNEYSKDIPIKRRFLQNRRPVFWKRLPWEIDVKRPTVKYTFPPSELISKLADAYFEHVNLFYPLLHRPTFERAVANGLHLNDEGFGGVLLLVCAVGARYTDKIDEKTLSEGTNSHYSTGWKWYNQVQVVKQGLFRSMTLYDLQSYCLAIQFINGCYAPQAAWILSGFGIRLAQDVGAHRQRIPLEKLTVQDELWKRAFWVIVALDRLISMGMGRPCAIFDDHFDIDMPVECDDEYWEHPDQKKRFRQPKDIPSTLTAFNLHLRLYKIMAYSMNTIYSIKTKFWELMLHGWEQHMVAELDSALNNWLSSLPEYLRWDPDRTDDRFFKLSGSLITMFYYVQILIHCPYITARGGGQPTPLSLPSLALCSSAARSCSLVLEQQMKRFVVMYPYMAISASIAGVVLLLNMWSSKQTATTEDPITTKQIEICMDVLRKAEERWRSCGIYLDVMNDLTTTGQLLLSEEETGPYADNPSGISTGNQKSSSSPCEAGLFSTNFRPSILFPPVPDSQPQTFTQNIGENSRFNPQETTFGSGFYDNTIPMIFGHGAQPTSSINAPTRQGISLLSIHLGHQQTVTDPTMDMWINAPNGFELNEWNSLLLNFTELTNDLYHNDAPCRGDGTQESYTMH